VEGDWRWSAKEGAKEALCVLMDDWSQKVDKRTGWDGVMDGQNNGRGLGASNQVESLYLSSMFKFWSGPEELCAIENKE